LAPAQTVEKATFNAGVTTTAGVGKRISQHLRFEAQLGYVDYTLNHVNPFANDPDYPRLDGRPFDRIQGGRLTRVTGDVIGFYDFNPLRWGVTPYVGVGFGGSENNRALGTFASSDGVTLTTPHGSGAEGFGVAEIGLSIPMMSQSIILAPSYRFVRYRPTEDSAHVFSATLRYAF
jgi:opacity protein-like surface antigen